MEDVVTVPASDPYRCFGGAYEGRRVFVTGHTGFKGSWLTLWLTMLGARVRGYALGPPSDPALWDLLALGAESGVDDVRADVRDLEALASSMEQQQPEVCFHLAAQPLVLEGYEDPVGTFAANVMGTVNLLEAVRRVPSVRAVVIVTSDKCYENREEPGYAYVESDPMGGFDPYSASKGAAEIAIAAYRRSFFDAPGTARVASVRAGNVIGGGDWAADRLVPDAMRALAAGKPVSVRNPGAVRPWQHVLDPLAGYLRLGSMLLADGGAALATSFNFGPPPASAVSVAQVMDRIVAAWPGGTWTGAGRTSAPHEATYLALDWSKAARELAWAPVLDLDHALDSAIRWYAAYYAAPSVAAARTRDDVAGFVAAAAEQGRPWAMEARL
jgi:CDP-glucose 4,6-dehydratase